jgi:anti-sigma factor RsiW
MTAENDDDGTEPDRPDESEAWQDALDFWRSYTAEMFNDALKEQVRDCVARTSSTIEEWRAAIRGDAASAIKIALGMRMPEEVNARLDLTMTVLLAAAFEDAVAASVMVQLLNKAPLDPIDRTGLSTSWMLHNIWCESRIRNARRRRRLHGGHGAGV